MWQTILKRMIPSTRICGILSISIATRFWISCNRSSSYSNFVNHKASYYEELARACDEIISKTPENATNKTLNIDPVDNKALPALIQDLHASEIRVCRNGPAVTVDGTNYVSGVSIMIGVSRTGYGISWRQNDYGSNNAPWELTVNPEGPSTVLYSTKDPVWRKPLSFDKK